MSGAPIMPLLAMVILLVVVGLAAFRRPAGPRSDRPKSKLARDGGLGGVGFLVPQDQREAVKALRRKAGVL